MSAYLDYHDYQLMSLRLMLGSKRIVKDRPRSSRPQWRPSRVETPSLWSAMSRINSPFVGDHDHAAP
jgi:hypothetical protein